MSRLVKIEWEPAAECFMLDFYFETAPPEHQHFHIALGREELSDLHRAVTGALLKVPKSPEATLNKQNEDS